MTPEEAVRKVRACRDDYQRPREEACFTLLKFAEQQLQLGSDKENLQVEEKPQNADELYYYTSPTLGILTSAPTLA